MAKKAAALKSKAASEPDNEAAHWKEQIELADRDRQKWVKRSKSIVKRYRDERDGPTENRKRLNLLWSNVQTLMPSVYGRQPVPIVERRFLDRDPVGKTASQILERALRYDMEDSEFHASVKRSVMDYLLVGRGINWVRYEPSIGEGIDEGPQSEDSLGDDDPGLDEADEDTNEPPAQKVLGEAICVDYVHWEDFYTFPPKARTWEEVEAVGKRAFMSRKELVEQFGEKVGKKIPLDHKPDNTSKDTPRENFDKATVFEIWDKTDKKVRFIANGYDDICKEDDDPLKLEGFWPCPRPLYGTLTNDTLIPVPDFVEYQDQALEIDDLTQRIAKLTSALKVAGGYDASAPALQRLLTEDCENELIAVNSWAAFAEKGGLQGAISFLPIKETADVLLQLYDAREKQKADLYEITGIADIIRGNSDPNETARAQEIKGHFATIRLRDKQDEVARYCRDIICIMGELIAEHFSPETLITASGILYEDGVGPDIPPMPDPPPPPSPQAGPMPPQSAQPGQAPPQGAPPGQPPAPPPDPLQQYLAAMMQYQAQVANIQALTQKRDQLIAQAIALLREEKLRGFRVDIETDTTIAEDVQQDKQSTTEFITAVSTYIEQGMQAAAQNPDIIPVLTKMLLFAVRRFRVGRDLEATFEEFSEKAMKQAKMAAQNPRPPDPEIIKAQAAAQAAQAEVQKATIESEGEKANAQLHIQIENIKAQIVQQKGQQDAQLEQMRHQFKIRELQMQHTGKSDEQLVAEQHIAEVEESRRQAHEQSLANLHANVQNIAQTIANLHSSHQVATGATNTALANIAQHVTAPAEIVHDRNGRPIAVRKGGLQRTIQRDGNQRITGLH